MNGGRYFAHSLPERPQDEWETVEEHLQDTADLCSCFAATMGAEEWGRVAGLWHDLGKYSQAFQDYLRTSAATDIHGTELKGTIDHSSAGAQWAIERGKGLGMILAHVIAGHHAGLLNFEGSAGAACLRDRLEKEILPWQENVPKRILEQPLPRPPNIGEPEGHVHAAFRVSLWIRMLFSCLVDADFLATERFCDPERALGRPQASVPLPHLLDRLNRHMDDLTGKAEPTAINRRRAEILQACRARAAEPRGFFDLSVPTGGGKTLASLAFALEHALAHGLRRVIVAVPFTSIIEQNVKVYRDALGDLGELAVLEHHSNLDPKNETQATRLQSENWDAPIIVTTNVQLFESLFANRTSRCRKLHRIPGSVIVLDEAQALPVELLKPTLWALRELVERHGCTVVLCSATRPALNRREEFPIGLEQVRPIVPDSARLYQAMRRVHVTVERTPLEDEPLAERLLSHDRVLCIVNTRGHAARLSELLGRKDGHHHLSTRMCGAHRQETLGAIRTQLAPDAERNCRVVSTQLVEAGVDLDFPAVYRARCGVDSLVQAAGRCNREGRLDSGEIVFFAAPEPPPRGFLRQTAQVTEEILHSQQDLLSPEAVTEFFRKHYWLNEQSWDKRKVLETVGNNPNTMRFQFRDMGNRYRFIDDPTLPVLVPWGSEGEDRIARLRSPAPPDRAFWRSLQRYVVQVHRQELQRLYDAGALELVRERWVLIRPDYYDPWLGLVLHGAPEENLYIF